MYFRNIEISLSGNVKDKNNNPLIEDKNMLKNKFYYFLIFECYTYTLEEFKFWYKRLDNSYSEESLIELLLYKGDVNLSISLYIISKLHNEINIENLMIYLKYGISKFKVFVLKLLFNKYRYLLKYGDIHYLKEEIFFKYKDDLNMRYEILDILN